MDGHFWWYLSRASGLTAWLLLAAAVCWGLAVVGRPTARPSAGWLVTVHGFLGACGVAFTALHLGALALDTYVGFGWRELFVPFASTYRPAAVAWGIVAFYLLVVIQASSWLRGRIPRRLWRGLHWLTYPLLGAASWHAFAAGTDAAVPALRWVVVAVGAAIIFLLAHRMLGGRRRPGDGPEPAPGQESATPPAADDDLNLLVRQTRWEADRVMSLVLADPAGGDLPAWEPGAHVELALPSGQARQYSLCGDPGDRRSYRIAVLRSPDSRGGSREVHDEVRAGRLVGVRGPRQLFELVEAPAYVFVAGGIGITPMLPMARQVQGRGLPWHLYYTGRERAGLAFLDELAGLPPDRVSVSATTEDGRLDVSSAVTTAAPGTAVYCCGPETLVQAVEEVLPAGVEMHVERFSAPADARPAGPAAPFEVELRRSGLVLPVPADTSLLDVVRGAGATVPSSCGEGICGTCEVRVLDGVPDHRDSVLTDAERQRGEVMMVCVSRSCTPRLTIDL